MADDNKLIFEIDFDTGEAKRKFGKVEGQAERSGKKSGDGFSRRFESSVGDIAIGNIIADKAQEAIAALGREFTESVGRISDFQLGITEINSLLPQSQRLSQGLTKELRALSREFATAPTKQTKAFYQIISSGAAEGAEATELLGIANELALGGLADLGSTINVLSDILNVYGKENISAREAADSLFQTVASGKTTLEELAPSVGRILPLAERFGVSLDEVNASLAELTTQGLSTSERVTQIRQLFTALSRQGGNVEKFGKDVGEAFSVSALRAKGLVGFLRDLGAALENSNVKMIELVGSAEAEAALVGLLRNNVEGLNNTLVDFSNKQGAAKRSADELRGAMKFQFKQVASNFDFIVDTIVSDFTPALVEAASGFNTLVESMTAVGDNSQKITDLRDRLSRLQQTLVETESVVGGEESFLQKIFGGPDTDEIKRRISALTDEINRLSGSTENVGPMPLPRDTTESIQQQAQPVAQPTPFVTPSGQGGLMEGAVSQDLAKAEAGVISLEEKLKGLSPAMANVAKNFSQSSQDIANAMVSGIGQAAGSAFSAFGAALVEGENALEAFTKAFIQSIGQAAVQLGTRFILEGLAFMVHPLFAGAGPPLIAAGAALAAFGGALSAVSGGGAPSGGSGDGGSVDIGGGGFGDTGNIEDEVETEPQTIVNLNVQGDILDNQDTPRRLAELLNAGFEEENLQLRGVT